MADLEMKPTTFRNFGEGHIFKGSSLHRVEINLNQNKNKVGRKIKCGNSLMVGTRIG